MKTANLRPPRNGNHTKPLDGPIVEKSEAEKAREVIRQDEEKRAQACIAEIGAVLKNHGCDIIVTHPAFGPNPLVINGVAAGLLIRPLTTQ